MRVIRRDAETPNLETPGAVASTEIDVSHVSKSVPNKATGRRQELPVSSDAQSPFQVTAEIFPNTIRFGDYVYIAVYLKNIASTPWSYLSELEQKVNDPVCFSITSSELPGLEARCYFERQTRLLSFSRPPFRTLAPGERRLLTCCVVEVPALEDVNEPFYRALKEKIALGPVACDLNIKRDFNPQVKPVYGGEALHCSLEGRLSFVVESRPESETALLHRWLANTKKHNLLPRVVDHRNKVAWQDKDSPDLPATSTSYFEFGARRFSPWDFIRPGNRKPSTPNNPTTVDGWRKLEAEFAPSTLRDEITLTRLQLEYYDAAKGEASDAALKILVDWLSQRPEPQRVVLSQSLLSKRAQFKGTSLEAKNATLCDALTSVFPVETPTTDDAK